MNKSRGKFLTIMIVFAAIGDIGFVMTNYLHTLYQTTNTNLVPPAFETMPSWLPLYKVASLLLGILTIIGLWMMRKWGVYLLALHL